MESFIGTAALILGLIWAFRIEKNTAITAETLKRIEKELASVKKETK